MAQLSNLTAGDASDETALLYLALTSGSDRNRKLALSTLIERIRTKTQTLTNKTLDAATCEVPTAALTELYLLSRNILDNPHGVMAQRFSGGLFSGSLTVGDAAYGHDRWYALVQTGNLTATTLSNDGLHRFMRLTNAAGSAQRYGYAQIVEAAHVQGLRLRDIVLSAQVRCSAALTVRYAILAWTGTADSVTKDVVNTWTSTNFTTGNFFASSNLTLLGTGATAIGANAVTPIDQLTVEVPSNANNLIVFLWTDSTVANGGTFDVAAQLEEGSWATPMELRPVQIEELRCRRFYQVFGLDDAYSPMASGMCTSTSEVRVFRPLEPPMRSAPSMTHSGLAVIKSGGAHEALTALSVDRVTTKGITLNGTVAATPLLAGNATILIANNTAAGYLRLSADL